VRGQASVMLATRLGPKSLRKWAPLQAALGAWLPDLVRLRAWCTAGSAYDDRCSATLLRLALGGARATERGGWWQSGCALQLQCTTHDLAWFCLLLI